MSSNDPFGLNEKNPIPLLSLPKKWRQVVYVALGVVGVVLGAVQVAFLVLDSQPVWLNIALAVFAFLTGGSNAVAKHNV